MKRWWRGTFGLVAIVALGFALATLVIGMVAFETTHEALELQLDHRIAIETQALMDEGEDGPQGVTAAILRREAARTSASLGYLLVDAEGRHLAGDLNAVVPATPGYVELLPYSADGEQRFAQSLTTLLPSGHRLLVAADRAVINEMDNTLIQLFLCAFGAMLLLGITASWVVGIVTRSRLARIDQTAMAIIGGDLTRRVPLSGSGDEFESVAATLNRMLDRIGGLMDNLRQVSSDVAHDLRTPLTRLHNRLDEALGSTDPNVQLTAIAAARAQSSELLEIFAALLRITEVEGMGSGKLSGEVPLSDVVEGIVETYRPDMEGRGYTVVSDISHSLYVRGDRRLLQQLLTNLLDNVLAHAPSHTTVTVALKRMGGNAIQLVVADNGPGITGDPSRLFHRFARSEQSRTTAGHGLGLALVAAIATAHSGEARIMPGPGFSVSVELPVVF